jgi:hypothetical protein
MKPSTGTLRHAALLTALLGLAGCAPSLEDRINATMPVSDAVTSTYTQLAEADVVDAAFEREFAGRLRIRAIECSRGRDFPWWEAKDALRKALEAERMCFEAADEALVHWLRKRQVGLLLAQPALRPQADTPLSTFVRKDAVQHVAFAEAAGVAALMGGGRVAVVDTGDGREVGSIQVDAPGPVALSPNGRVLAIGTGDGVALRDTQGRDLGALADVAMGRAWWLADGTLGYNDARDNALHVVDFATARDTRLGDFGGVQSVVRLRETPGRSHVLGRQGAAILIVAPNAPPQRPSVSVTPLPGMSVLEDDRAITEDGRIYGVAEGGVLEVERAGNRKRLLPLGDLPIEGLMLTADPRRLLLTLPGDGRADVFVFSLDDGTLAAMTPALPASARLEYLPTLRRNVVIDGGSVQVLDAVRTAPAEPVAVVAKRYQGAWADAEPLPAAPAPAAPAPATIPIASTATPTPRAAPSGPYATVNGREVPITPEVAPTGPFAQINGRVIPVPEPARPTRATAPVDPSVPRKKGREALVEGLRSGVLRLATEADLNEWKRSYEQHARHGVSRRFLERINHTTMYVITGDYTIPEDLTGSASAVFIVARRAPFPNGESSHSAILDVNSGACMGWSCRALSEDE